MTTSLKRFATASPLGVTAANLASTTSTEKAFIGKFTAANTSTSNVLITIWSLDSTTTETTGIGGNWLVQKTIPAGKTVLIEALQGLSLNPSQKISGLADTASVINIDISGTTET